MKTLVKLLFPPIVFLVIKKIFRRNICWKDGGASWGEAAKKATGYDADLILERVKMSLMSVKNGDASYERDGVIFNEVQYSWPLLSGLMFASSKNLGRLSVVDFGGSLGSSYYQNKLFLDSLEDLKWGIVEQQHFVNTGKEFFQDDRLSFFNNISDCVMSIDPKVLVLSSVLQYLEEPYEILDEIFQYDFEVVIIDRTPFSILLKDQIKLQFNPESIYKASYPCWFFDKKYFMNYFLSKNYRLVSTFDCAEGIVDGGEFLGMILVND